MAISVTEQVVNLYCPCGCPCTLHLTVTREVEGVTEFPLKGKAPFPLTSERVISTNCQIAETTCNSHKGALTHIASLNRLCLRCGKAWIAKRGDSPRCPQCNSPYWNEPDESKIPRGGGPNHVCKNKKRK